MMKNYLSLIILVSLMFGVGGVLADSQNIGAGIEGNINFTLITSSLSYGSLIPGQTSEVQATTITVEANNNVDFNINIMLTVDDVSGIFSGNIWLEDTATQGSFTVDKLDLNTPIERLIEDTNEGAAFDETLNSVLKVPITTGPITGATGTVTYTISGVQP
jgi:hypothetical protein